MPVPKTGALPLGDAPAGRRLIARVSRSGRPDTRRLGLGRRLSASRCFKEGVHRSRRHARRPDPFISAILQPAVHQIIVIAGQLPGEVPNFEAPRTRGLDQGDFSRAAGKEELLEAL